MKIKGSVKGIKTVYIVAAFIFGTVICTALRLYHCVSLIDRETGFYERTDFTVILFYAVLFSVTAFILIGGFLSKNDRRLNESVLSSNKPLGISSLVLSAGMLIESGYSLISAASSSGGSGSDMSGFAFMMKNGSLPYRMHALFSFISAIYFLVFAVNCFRKTSRMASKKIFALTPVAWACTGMIPLFVKQISFIRVSDLFLEIITVAFFIIYTLSVAQCISGVYAEEASWRIVSVGLVSAMYAITLNLPKLIFVISGKSGLYVTAGYPVNYAEITFGIFALILAASFIKKGLPAKAATMPAEETAVSEAEAGAEEEN